MNVSSTVHNLLEWLGSQPFLPHPSSSALRLVTFRNVAILGAGLLIIILLHHLPGPKQRG